MKTPIVLIIFNRPDYTARLFEVIRQVQPEKLLVIADGPRPDRPEDQARCAAARAVIDRVDWHCEVFRDFSDVNLTCGARIATGISWVFEQVEEAIILEDDCIPDPSFFAFCEAMLERYREDERIMHVSGNNFWSDQYPLTDSYVFSRYTLSWGWATWRRAWKHYDFDLKHWPAVKADNKLADILGDRHTVKNWTETFQYQADTDFDGWDYQWLLTCWLQSGLAILPSVNLTSNVGFGPDATHTFSAESMAVDEASLSRPTAAMRFPLKHPDLVMRHGEIDRLIQDVLYDYHPKLLKRIKKRLYRIIRQRSGRNVA
jgi:hypothetical protein